MVNEYWAGTAPAWPNTDKESAPNAEAKIHADFMSLSSGQYYRKKRPPRRNAEAECCDNLCRDCLRPALGSIFPSSGARGWPLIDRGLRNSDGLLRHR